MDASASSPAWPYPSVRPRDRARGSARGNPRDQRRRSSGDRDRQPMKQLRARADFETARIQAFLRDAGSVLRGDTRPLLSFDEVRRAARLEGQSYRGLKDVPIADIRGSVGRPNDFDASFLPVRPQMRERWAQLDTAMRPGEAVPPIEVYHIGDISF